MAAPSPAVAALLATFIPGGGQLYLDDEVSALATAGTEAALAAAIVAAPAAGDEASDYFLTPRFLGLLTLQQVHVYSIYAAYRDARLARGDGPPAAALAENGVGALLAAPFTPEVVADPEVALPVGTLIAVAAAASLLDDGAILPDPPIEILGTPLSRGWALAAQTSVHGSLSLGAAVSEEALFRGMIQDGLMESWRPSGAIGAQAALFGLAHAPNAYMRPGSARVRNRQATLQVAVTTLLGAWMGYMTWADRGDLRRSVAFHFWYNMVVMTAGFLSDPHSWPLRLALTVPLG